MAAARTSKTSVDNYFTRQYIPEDKSERLLFCLAIYKLNKIITEYDLTISTDKRKVMAFKGRNPTGSKIVINYKTRKYI
jgi:hypothetical protein